MLNKKPARRKQHQRATRANLIGLGFIVIIVGVSYLVIEQFDALTSADEQVTEEEAAPAVPSPEEAALFDMQQATEHILTSDDDALDDADEAGLKKLRNTMRTSADATDLQLLQADVTGDGQQEWLLIHGYKSGTDGREAFSHLREAGYEHIISGFEVLSRSADRVYSSILFVDKDRMAGKASGPLIDQVPAQHGYAFRTIPHDEPPYEQPAMLFGLALLDENARLASDDLTLYWHPGRQDFSATNAFGQPGTFDE